MFDIYANIYTMVKPKPKLRLTAHFQERMVERGINIDHVKKAIRGPDNKGDAYEDKMWVEKKIDDKTIKVIYSKEGFRDKPNQFIVVTAYYLD